MSIFTKDCPQCAETNAAYAVRCKCGFAFNADDGVDSQTEEEIALEEEKLYQEYLAARARQASGGADDAAKLAAAQLANQAKLEEAEQAKAERAQADLEVQTTRVVDSATQSQAAKVEPPAAPAVAQTPKVESAPPPAPKSPTATPPVQTTVPEGAAERKQAKVEPPAVPAVAPTPKVESAPPPAPKPPTTKPPVQTTVPAATTQTQAPKPSAETKQSWLIPAAESDAQSDTTTPPPAAKPATTTPAKRTTKSTNARPTPTAANVDVAKMSAAERAKKLEQRLKEVQAKRGSNATTTGANATSKINTSAEAAKPNPDSAVKGPATPQTTTAPTAAKTDDTSATPPSKPTSAALDTKPDQPQMVDKTTPPEPKRVNGSDTVPPPSDTIEVPAAKEAVQSPSNNATAKADLEAALQALNTKAPDTDPAVSTPTESGNGADQADALPEALLDTNAQAPLGDLTQKSGLGCTEKECPNCTALVPMDADSCGCGFTFPTEDNAMPSLSLTDSDFEALEKRKKSSGIRHLS